jgi:hypothetical protein
VRIDIDSAPILPPGNSLLKSFADDLVGGENGYR